MNEREVEKLFAYKHLPENLQEVSAPFHLLAILLTETLQFSSSRTKALNALWEAKNWAVVNKVNDGDI